MVVAFCYGGCHGAHFLLLYGTFYSSLYFHWKPFLGLVFCLFPRGQGLHCCHLASSLKEFWYTSGVG